MRRLIAEVVELRDGFRVVGTAMSMQERCWRGR